MELNNFPPWQYAIVIAGFLTIFFGLIHYEFYNKVRIAIILVVIGSLLLRIFAVVVEPFINLWDEQYHALVAKNMIDHPFKPMLYSKPWLSYDISDWGANHIWLHKQPLFLWQMALSMKIFGVNEIALRLPSVLMLTIASFFTFRIGKLLIDNKVGLYAAALFSTNYFVFRLMNGKEATDHNDIAFLFYVTSSIWAWVEYQYCSDPKKSRKWVILIGLFAGMAVLNKWITGLIIFSAWFFNILAEKESRSDLNKYFHLLTAFLVSVAIFLPWQIYISIAFPVESAQENALNTQNFSQIVEGHGGGNWYHLEMLSLIYGNIAPYIFIPSLTSFFKRSNNKIIASALLIIILIIYLFFTIAATKMRAFTLPVASLISIGFAALAYELFDFISANVKSIAAARTIIIAFLLLTCYLNMNMPEVETSYGNRVDFPFRNGKFDRAKSKFFYVSLRQQLHGKEYVIFNVPALERVFAMFYLPYSCYESLPDQNTISNLKRKGLSVAVIKQESLPDYIENDNEIIKLVPPDKDVISNTKIQLQAFNQKFLCEDAHRDRMIIADRLNPSDWETFNLIQFKDSSYAVRTFSGYYLSAQVCSTNKIESNREKAEDWEHFKIIWLNESEIAIKSCKGLYVSVLQDGSIIANQRLIDNECKFNLKFPQ